MTSTLRRMPGYLGLAVILAGLSGCAHQQHGATAEVPAGSATADLDTRTGAIALPIEAYTLAKTDDDEMNTAISIRMSACAAERGVDFRPTPVMSDVSDVASNFFGVWIPKYAEKFGFVPPNSNADLAANGVKGAPHVVLHGIPSLRHNGTLTDAEWKVVDACRDEAPELNSDVVAPQGPWVRPAQDAENAALGSKAAKEVESDYDACLTSKGLEPDPESPGFVKGADVHTISPQQIALALKVVDCKTQVHYVQRLTSLIANAQAPIVAKYHQELVAQRQRIDAALVKAKKVIADYQRDHPEFT